MADPQGRLAQGLRSLGLAPPSLDADQGDDITAPPPPPPLAAPPATAAPAEKAVAKKAVAKKAAPAKAAAKKATTTAHVDASGLPGRPIGNRWSLTVYVPDVVRSKLDEEVHTSKATKGVVIMRALRSNYHAIAQEVDAEKAEETSEPSPFPEEARVRRRPSGLRLIPTTLTASVAEVQALVDVAEGLDMNYSELVSAALAKAYGLNLNELVST